MVRRETKFQDVLDYHEGFSINQAKILLRKFDLDFNEFDKWLYGQTCPVVIRHNKETGKEERVTGVYEYDLFRYIEAKKANAPLIFD